MDLFESKKQLITSTEAVYSNDLLSALDSHGPKIKILSLDCFDTILWRKTASPFDVFYEMQKIADFKDLGFAPTMRNMAEIRARHLKYFNQASK